MLGEKIQFYRKNKNMSQEALADALGVTRQSISLWETDQSMPSTDNLLKMSELFNASIDELCGNKKEEVDDYIAKGESVYDKQLLKKAYLQFNKRRIVLGIVGILLSLAIIISLVIEGVSIPFIILAIVFCLIFTSTLVSLIYQINKRVLSTIRLNPSIVSTYYFYNDYVKAFTKTTYGNSTRQLFYKDVKKKEVTNDTLYLLFDESFIVIKLENLDSKERLLEKFQLSEKTKKGKKYNPVMNGILVALFVLSICSIFIAMITVGICENLSRYPQSLGTMTEYMWIFFLFLPIPVSSFVMGIIYKIKGYKCLKNIIAGSIMAFFLFIYGMFTILFKDQISHDYGYMNQIEEVVNIDFPDEGYISIDLSVKPAAYVRFEKIDIEAFVESIKNDGRWKDTIAFMPADMLDSIYISRITGCDYYCLFDVNASTYNNVQSKANHKYILLAYNTNDELLTIIELIY